MRRLLLLVCFVLPCLCAAAQDLDSLYSVFENSKGKTAYQVAVAIDETIGREPNFEPDTDKDEIKLKVLRTMILYFFNNDDFEHVVTYSEIGIAHYAKIDDLFNEAGCYMTLANAYQRLGQPDGRTRLWHEPLGERARQEPDLLHAAAPPRCSGTEAVPYFKGYLIGHLQGVGTTYR